MKVLMVTNMYPTESRPYFGVFVKEFVETLRELGTGVSVFFTDVSDGRAAYIKQIPRLRRVLAANDHDVIHAQHTYCMYQIRLAQMLSTRRRPVVFTIHEGESLMPEGLRDEDADLLKRMVYFKKPKQWAMNWAGHAVSVNPRIPRALGYARSYSVIPPGVDLELFKPLPRPECRKRLGIATDKPVLFFPANPAIRIKGIELIEAARRHLPVEVEIVTGGSIAHEDMPYYMNAADVVVQASSFEASPMVVKEAMAVNVPMVSTDVGDIREIFGDTRGYFLSDADPESIAAKIGEALKFKGPTKGRQRVIERGLSLKQVAKRYIEVYESLVNEHLT